MSSSAPTAEGDSEAFRSTAASSTAWPSEGPSATPTPSAGPTAADALDPDWKPSSKTGDNIQVVGRFRPLSDREYAADPDGIAVRFHENGQSCTVALENGRESSFSFNRMFQ